MSVPENANIRSEKAQLLAHYRAGIDAGMTPGQKPVWVYEFYSQHPPHERGLLLGVLVAELVRMEAQA